MYYTNILEYYYGTLFHIYTHIEYMNNIIQIDLFIYYTHKIVIRWYIVHIEKNLLVCRIKPLDMTTAKFIKIIVKPNSGTNTS